MTSAILPPHVRVFVRDWVSSNNVLLKGRDAHVLIDTGYVRHAPALLQWLAGRDALGDEPLAHIVNTHCHSDHMGGNAAVAKRYGCPIAVPEGEAPLIAEWNHEALLLDYADQTADRFDVDAVLRDKSRYLWGDLEWEVLAAPGHDMSAVVFYNAEHGILISGDALWQNGFGIVMPRAIDAAALPATRSTIEMLARLDVKVVIPGHGAPFTGFDRAIEVAMQRLAAFEADDLRVARHILKVILTFHLLERGRVALADLPDYLARVGFYRDFNARFFNLAPADLAELLVGELERGRVARRVDGWLLPASADR